jgi:hypothetical protein
MDIRALLVRCRHSPEELKALRRQLGRLDGESAKNHMVHYRELLTRREKDAENDLASLEELIGGLRDTRTRTVMRYYYAMGFSDTQIGEEMDITDEWVRKKRYAAVRLLERRCVDRAKGA